MEALRAGGLALTISVRLGRESAEFVAEQVRSGRYASATEVVEEGLRRLGHQGQDAPPRLGFAGWQLDTRLRRLRTPAGEMQRLSAAECRLLQALVESAGQALSREALSPIVCNREWLPSDRRLDALVAQLRERFRRHDRGADYIATIHGLGYLFTAG